MLFFRKIFQYFFIEIPGILITSQLIFSLLFFLKKEKKIAKYLSIFALLLYILSSGWFARIFVSPLETAFDPIRNLADLKEKGVIVVLGGGIIPETPDYPESGELEELAQKRVITAFKLYSLFEYPIIVTGGRPPKTFFVPESVVMKRELIELSVDPEDVYIEPDARTTEENAKYVSKILKELNVNKIYLITSAVHMLRSYKYMKYYLKDVDIVPVPSNYLISYSSINWTDFLPDAGQLFNVSIAFHEYIGLLYQLLSLPFKLNERGEQ